MINYADVAICLIMFISIGIGVYMGFVKEVLFLASLILALILAFYLSDYPAQWLLPASSNWGVERLGFGVEGESIVFVISFILIFLIALVIGGLLSNALSKLVSQTPVLKSINRVLGAVFGFLRGALIVVLLVIFGELTKVSVYPWWQQSQLLPPFVDGTQYLLTLLPARYSQHFDFGVPVEKEDGPAQLKPVPERNMREQIV